MIRLDYPHLFAQRLWIKRLTELLHRSLHLVAVLRGLHGCRIERFQRVLCVMLLRETFDLNCFFDRSEEFD